MIMRKPLQISDLDKLVLTMTSLTAALVEKRKKKKVRCQGSYLSKNIEVFLCVSFAKEA